MSDKRGYIKIYRSLFDNPVVTKDNDYLALWIYLLCEATHKDYPVIFGGKKITLSPGQLTTGRNRLAAKLNINSSKVQRILKCFEIEQQIEQRTDYQCRLISIVNWSEYQNDEQRNEQQVNSDRTASEQRVNTKQKHKNIRTQEHNNIYVEKSPKNIIPPTLDMVRDYCKERHNQIDPSQFCDFYEAKGWKVGKEKMKDWQACIRTWEKREKKGENSFIGILSEYED